MYVQPYFPEQIEIQGNIAAEAYDVRLRFVRLSVGMHLLSAALVAAAAVWVSAPIGPTWSCWVFLGLLAAMSASRLILHRGRADIVATGILLPPTLLPLSWALRWAFDLGWPSWSLIFPIIGSGLYTAFCGRDFSFVGQWMVSGFVSLVGIGAVAWFIRPGGIVFLNASTFALAYLTYYVYDLAALLTRRRRGEEFGAVVDLYRDVLNFTTYTARVVQHWRKFRI